MKNTSKNDDITRIWQNVFSRFEYLLRNVKIFENYRTEAKYYY